jgi:lipoyl(octanoyl) transferase
VEGGVARVIELGRRPYLEVWELQKRLVDEVADGAENTVLVVEHDPVFTVGRRRGAEQNVLAPGDAPVVEVERGGDVTWHGPGQLVAYPILRLVGVERDLHAHLHRLEDLMIAVCADFGLAAGRDPRNTGAWIGGRKVGSIGIACRRWVTWHGLALNVRPDLSWFARVNPCGFAASVMTSMEAERGAPVDFGAVQRALVGRVSDW